MKSLISDLSGGLWQSWRSRTGGVSTGGSVGALE